MSKDETKRENKDIDGDPVLRGRRRQRARELSMARKSGDVAGADVVLVNPTHYAVALRYSVEEMSAPRVVAKGKDEVAARIRKSARHSGVPMIHNPPLTRALFAAVKTGREVPPAFYGAVAEVLAVVYRNVRERSGRAIVEGAQS